MKKILLYFFILIILLTTSCNHKGDAKDLDVSQEYIGTLGRADEKDNMFYFRPLGSRFVYYYDDMAGFYGVLCGKPECLHDNESCNAYLGIMNCGIQVYDRHIYWIDGTTVKRMDLDGENHEVLFQIEEVMGKNPCFAIHRGQLYTSVIDNAVVEGKTIEALYIKQYNLNEKEAKAYLIYEGSAYSYQRQFYNDKLYFLITEYSSGRPQVLIYGFDTEKDQLDLLWQGERPWYSCKDFLVDEDGITVVGDEGLDYYALKKFRFSFSDQNMTIEDITSIKGDYSEILANHGFSSKYVILTWYEQIDDERILHYRITDWTGNVVCEGELEDQQGSYISFIVGKEDGFIIGRYWNEIVEEQVSYIRHHLVTSISVDGEKKEMLNYGEFFG